MGRKKIKIAPIQGERNRTATFVKRKTGLFKKAHELAILTDSDIAVIVFNRNGKLAEFCSGDMDEFLLRYTEYSGTVEKRGPEHYLGVNDSASEAERSMPSPTWTTTRSSEVLATTRARIDSRRMHSKHETTYDAPLSQSMLNESAKSESFTDANGPPLPATGRHALSAPTLVAPPDSTMKNVLPQEWPPFGPPLPKAALPIHRPMLNNRVPNALDLNGDPSVLPRRWSSGNEMEYQVPISPLSTPATFDARRFMMTTIPAGPNEGPVPNEKIMDPEAEATIPSPNFPPQGFACPQPFTLTQAIPEPINRSRPSPLNLHTESPTSHTTSPYPSPLHSAPPEVHTPLNINESRDITHMDPVKQFEYKIPRAQRNAAAAAAAGSSIFPQSVQGAQSEFMLAQHPKH